MWIYIRWFPSDAAKCTDYALPCNKPLKMICSDQCASTVDRRGHQLFPALDCKAGLGTRFLIKFRMLQNDWFQFAIINHSSNSSGSRAKLKAHFSWNRLSFKSTATNEYYIDIMSSFQTVIMLIQFVETYV